MSEVDKDFRRVRVEYLDKWMPVLMLGHSVRYEGKSVRETYADDGYGRYEIEAHFSVTKVYPVWMMQPLFGKGNRYRSAWAFQLGLPNTVSELDPEEETY